MILFLTPYPHDTAASQRFRFEQYYSFLKENGKEFTIQPFWDEKGWEILYKKGNTFLKLLYLIKGLLKRCSLVFTAKRYEFIFIHREIFPTGPLFLITLLSKVLKKKIIYDFDDAIWLKNYADNNKNFAFLKNYKQVPKLCKHAYKVSVGNEYLYHYAHHYNSSIELIPTTIDTENLHNRTRDKKNEKVVIGWTGTHSTLKYMLDLLPILDTLSNKFEFELLIISDKTPDFERPYLNFVAWNKENEIDDLLKMNVGIMPLTDDKWSRGKCGFKALQYMSLGIPAIVSPVGVNSEIVDHDINGWICSNWEDWRHTLNNVLEHPEIVSKMSESAREKIISKYSVLSTRTKFLNLFK